MTRPTASQLCTDGVDICLCRDCGSFQAVPGGLEQCSGCCSLVWAPGEHLGSSALLLAGWTLVSHFGSTRVVIRTVCSVQHSKEWWLGAVLSSSIPVIYSFSGGMRASIMTDTTQLVICVAFFIALLAVLGSKMPTAWDWNPNGELHRHEPI